MKCDRLLPCKVASLYLRLVVGQTCGSLVALVEVNTLHVVLQLSMGRVFWNCFDHVRILITVSAAYVM